MGPITNPNPCGCGHDYKQHDTFGTVAPGTGICTPCRESTDPDGHNFSPKDDITGVSIFAQSNYPTIAQQAKMGT